MRERGRRCYSSQMPFCNGRDTTKNTRERHLTRETMDELRRADDGRVVIRAKEREMGNDSTGTDETHINPGSSPALFVRETYQLLLSYHNDSYWCASTRKLESTISNARTKNGHVKYWNAGCSESCMSGVDAGKERKLLPMHTRRDGER
jgi:hypothetical protein